VFLIAYAMRNTCANALAQAMHLAGGSLSQ